MFVDMTFDTIFILDDLPLRFESKNCVLSISRVSHFVKEGSIMIPLFDPVNTCPLPPHNLLFEDLLDLNPLFVV